jgi:hypothetical protein
MTLVLRALSVFLFLRQTPRRSLGNDGPRPSHVGLRVRASSLPRNCDARGESVFARFAMQFQPRLNAENSTCDRNTIARENESY